MYIPDTNVFTILTKVAQKSSSLPCSLNQDVYLHFLERLLDAFEMKAKSIQVCFVFKKSTVH